MPELAEVEFYRKRWDLAARGDRVRKVSLHPKAKVFRGLDSTTLVDALTGQKFISSETAAKQILVRFSESKWLGIHLGMSGELNVHDIGAPATKHDHLILETSRSMLVFSDPRMFGRIQFHAGPAAPEWWNKIAPAILSKEFTVTRVSDFLRRRSRTPIKAVLLMQEQFPGIGNWMADEILWRATIHPKRLAGSLTVTEIQILWRECRRVCRQALDKIAGNGDDLPPDLNLNIPETWLFRHRWRAGGRCPLTGVRLIREEVGGRTTCWSPARQVLRPANKKQAVGPVHDQ
ncbi:MAG TPA: DNA-formamidopyrimidine glycosylase family protein [Opitutus sp.]|nr:DNA-formamidopyrimidine glycosylase family protein [Opitutus sp.]